MLLLNIISPPCGCGAEALDHELAGRLGYYEIENQVYYFNNTNYSNCLGSMKRL